MKWIVVLLLARVVPAAAQWLNYHDARPPRTKDGKPDLAARAPRMNSKPDLSGVWQAERAPVSEYNKTFGEDFAKQQVDFNDVSKHALNLFWGVKPA
jgi:hypothetical protein